MEFDRFISLIGKEKFNKVRDLTVLVVGLGGVGGYALEALARSGIKHFILFDDDKIESTNINRQIIANHKTIGKFKTEVFKERIKDISPLTKVDVYSIKFDEDSYKILNDFKIDYIVDAVDDVKAKKLLINYSVCNKIKIISSMSMGNRLDPSLLYLTTLDKTENDPIARILRKYVKESRIKDKIKVVSSHEVPIKVENRKIASCSFVPSVAGLLMASYIIRNEIK